MALMFSSSVHRGLHGGQVELIQQGKLVRHASGTRMSGGGAAKHEWRTSWSMCHHPSCLRANPGALGIAGLQ